MLTTNACRVAVGVVASLLLGAMPVSAQGPRAALQRVGLDRQVRVAVDGGRTQGRLTSIGETEIIIENGLPHRISMAAIDTVWRRSGSSGKGAIIGGVVGAVAFTGFLQFVVTIACEGSSTCADDRRRALGYGIVGGGAAGALLGAGVGGLFKRWARVEF